MDIHILQLANHSAMKYTMGHAKGDDYGSYLESVHDSAINLQQQGYSSVASVVISIQWSNGRPWERVDQSSPLRYDAGSEIDEIFAAERLVRHPEFEAAIRRSSVCRHSSVALLDAQLFGAGMTKSAKATLLGQALAIEYPLPPPEREILARMVGRTRVVDEPAFIAAIRSLLQRRLVLLDVI